MNHIQGCSSKSFFGKALTLTITGNIDIRKRQQQCRGMHDRETIKYNQSSIIVDILIYDRNGLQFFKERVCDLWINGNANISYWCLTIQMYTIVNYQRQRVI